MKAWEQELPKLEGKLKEATNKKEKPIEEVAPVMLGKRKSTAQTKQAPVIPDPEEKPKDGSSLIQMDHVLHYLRRSAKFSGSLLHQQAITLAARPN